MALTFWPALSNYVKSMLGIGLLSLPWAFAQSGMLVGCFGLVILAGFNWYTDTLICRCVAHERAVRAYGELASAKEDAATAVKKQQRPWFALGKKQEPPAPAPVMAIVVDHPTDVLGPWGVAFRPMGLCGQVAGVGAMLLGQLGVCVAYVDYMADFLDEYALSEGLWLLVLFPALALLSLCRPLGGVAYVSAAGLAVYVWVLGLLYYYFVAQLASQGGASPTVSLGPASGAAGVGKFFGVAVFAMEGVSTVLTIFEGMGGRDFGRGAPMRAVVCANYLLYTPVLLSVGALGYAAYGADVDETVLYSLPAGGWRDSGLIGLAAVLVLSYPIQMAPVYEVLEAFLATTAPAAAPWWAPIRIGLVGLTCLGAYAIPDTTTVVALTGDVCFAYIAFVAPALLYLHLRPLADTLVDAPPPAGGGGRWSLGWSRRLKPGDAADVSRARPRVPSWLANDAADVVLCCLCILLGVVGGVVGVYETLWG